MLFPLPEMTFSAQSTSYSLHYHLSPDASSTVISISHTFFSFESEISLCKSLSSPALKPSIPSCWGSLQILVVPCCLHVFIPAVLSTEAPLAPPHFSLIHNQFNYHHLQEASPDFSRPYYYHWRPFLHASRYSEDISVMNRLLIHSFVAYGKVQISS